MEANLLEAIANYFHHATPGLGFEAYKIQEWGEKQKEQAIATLHGLDRLLATQPYIACDRFTAV
jgi:glutathione S-transferase